MTLDEAIKHEEEIVKEEQYEYQECVATHNMEGAMNCRKYAEEHRQLAEWLKDYKRLLEQETVSRESYEHEYFLRKEFEMKIAKLEQEPKTGHWIDDKCSVCGKGIEDLIASPEWYSDEEPNFCPFCGIKIEPQENEGQNENCNTCIHHKPDNPYCECCFDLNKFESQESEEYLPKYEAKVITRGNCMMCGKELTEGLFFCKECSAKMESEEKHDTDR